MSTATVDRPNSSPPAAPFPATSKVDLLEVYRALRLARLNDKFYGDSLSRARLISKSADALTAVAASSSVIAAVTAAVGKGSMPVVILTVLAAVLAALKPVFNLAGRVDRFSRLWSGWHAAYTALARIRSDIEANQGWRPDLTPLYIDVIDRMDRLSPDDEPSPNRKAVERLTGEVNREMPAESFWMPNAAA